MAAKNRESDTINCENTTKNERFHIYPFILFLVFLLALTSTCNGRNQLYDGIGCPGVTSVENGVNEEELLSPPVIPIESVRLDDDIGPPRYPFLLGLTLLEGGRQHNFS